MVSQNPQQYARHGAVMTPRGRVDAHDHDAFAASVRYYAGLLDGLPPAWRLDGDRLLVEEATA